MTNKDIGKEMSKIFVLDEEDIKEIKKNLKRVNEIREMFPIRNDYKR
jgi:hypothetical protein